MHAVFAAKGYIVSKKAFILALCAISLNMAGGHAGEIAAGPGSPYYCPPGAKFCPAPGTDNTVFLDTHFGMDAKTGQVTAYTGTVHPNDVTNPPMTGEQVLYVAPPISVENRYVPYPGAPQTNMMASTATLAQPVGDPYASMNQIARPQSPPPVRTAQVAAAPQPTRTTQAIVGPQSYYPTQSEVANRQADRVSREERITQEDRVPWWKGGLWRNRGRDKSNDDDDDTPPARSTASSSASRQDDVWDEDEYTGYNPDGSVGRQQQADRNYQPGNDPYATPQFGGQPQYAPQQQYAQQQPYAQPYPDPYAQPVQQQPYYADPYAQPQAAPGPMYAGDAYTLPNSPPPTSPYPQGYVYPGTTQAYDPYQSPALTTAPSAPVYVDSPMMASAAPQNAAFLPPPPGSGAQVTADMGPPPSDATGSLQFENAVRMVKEGRFSEAKNLLTSETQSNPSHAAGWRWLGDCYYNLLELDDAITTYQRALDRDPNDYYALRGQGFAYLHRGHEHWRRMQEEVAMGQKDQAAATFAQAHDNYKKSLELLGFCLRRAPNDSEAVYGEAMAAEGASRKLYSNAISYLKLGPENRERAELFAENCLTVINKGVDRARERARLTPGESGPRALLGGLYLRKAILYNQLGKQDLALLELKNSRDVQQSILDEIDKNNATAQKGIREAESYWEAWGGNRN